MFNARARPHSTLSTQLINCTFFNFRASRNYELLREIYKKAIHKSSTKVTYEHFNVKIAV